MSLSIMSFRSPMWIHSWVKVHSAPLCRDSEERTHVQALTTSVWYLYPEQPRITGCHGNKLYRTHLLLWDALIRTHSHTLHIKCRLYTLNYPDTNTHLQGEWFPAGILQQCRGGAQSVLWPLLQREDDSARILTETVDQILQLPAHLKDRDDLEIKLNIIK